MEVKTKELPAQQHECECIDMMAEKLFRDRLITRGLSVSDAGIKSLARASYKEAIVFYETRREIMCHPQGMTLTELKEAIETI